ncbi:MAG: ABC transporter permease, partial [Anaerolineae bacterium]
LSLKRLGALIRKELIHLIRDRRTLMLIVTMPLIELFLFAYAVDLTVDHLPTAVADLSLDAESRSFLSALEISGFFDLDLYVADEAAVIEAIDGGDAKAGVVIPPDFAAQVARGDAQALLIFDGSDSFSVQSGYSAALSVAQAHGFGLVAEEVNRMGGRLGELPIESSVRVLYNPNLDDLVFIMPGLAAMLLQILSVNMTAQSVVREYEMGTIEQLLVTPARPLELVVGKLVPNILVAFLSLMVITLFAVFWFDVPFQGNPWLYGWLSLLFIISGLGLGLLVSTVAHTQKEAQQITATLMLLSQLLTGFIYPRSPMPPVVRGVGNLIPLTYFIRIIRGILTKGVGMAFFWSDVVALVIYSAVVMGLAAVTFKKRLD